MSILMTANSGFFLNSLYWITAEVKMEGEKKEKARKYFSLANNHTGNHILVYRSRTQPSLADCYHCSYEIKMRVWDPLGLDFHAYLTNLDFEYCQA